MSCKKSFVPLTLGGHRKRRQVGSLSLWGSGVLVVLLCLCCHALTATAQQQIPSPDELSIREVGRCAQDGHTVLVEEGEMVEGSIYDAAGSRSACAAGSQRSLLVLAEPSLPSLVFPYDGWNFRMVPGTLSGSLVRFTVQALCDDQPVCEAVLQYRIVGTTTTSTTAPLPSTDPTDVPRCVSDPSKRERVFEPNETYMGRFPLDQISTECSYTVEVQTENDEVPFGLLAVLPLFEYPLSYVYSVPALPEPGTDAVEFSLPYAIRCSGKLVCTDVLHFHVESTPPACPQNSVVRAVKPSSTVSGVIRTGVTCDPWEEEYIYDIRFTVLSASTSVAQGNGTTVNPSRTGTFRISDITKEYHYSAPEKEADVAVTFSSLCVQRPTSRSPSALSEPPASAAPETGATSSLPLPSSEPVLRPSPLDSLKQPCEAKLVFLVTAQGKEDDMNPNPIPDNNKFLSEKSFDVPLRSVVYGQLSVPNTSAVDACLAVRYTRVLPSPFPEQAMKEATETRLFDEQGQNHTSATVEPRSADLLEDLNSDSGDLDEPIEIGPSAGFNDEFDTFFTLNPIGQFSYYAALTLPENEKDSFIEVIDIHVWCVAVPLRHIGQMRLYFTNYVPIGPPPTSTTAPTTAPSGDETEEPLRTCANVYYYSTPLGMALSSSLRGVPGEDACTSGRYFSMTRPPAVGRMQLEHNGDFLFIPPPGVETAAEIRFEMYCKNQRVCHGFAYIVASEAFEPDEEGNGNTNNNNSNKTNVPLAHLRCAGTCVNSAWVTLPSKTVWDFEAALISSSLPPQQSKEMALFDGIDVRWSNQALVITAKTTISNMGVRFPTFGVLSDAENPYFDGGLENKGNVSAESELLTTTAFDRRCLTKQSHQGIAEDVWLWNWISANSGSGSLGSLYNTGQTWYQKFGGKHDHCNIFQTEESACQYAPLLTPAPNGLWSLDINDCTATWRGVFPYVELTDLQKLASGSSSAAGPVFTFTQPRLMEGTILTQAVQPKSWLEPSQGVESDVQAYRIRVGLRQYVEVIKTALDRPFSVDAEWFEYVSTGDEGDGHEGGSDAGDFGFGINLLLYPSLTEGTPVDFTADHRVVGFKWLQQQWNAPQNVECPTCSGTKLRCYAGEDFATSTYASTFPFGDCPPGIGRVHLFKGPSTSAKEQTRRCPSAASTNPPLWITARRGFSPANECATNFQNLTLRGVLPGSRLLTAEQTRELHVDGLLLLQVLTEDGFRYNIRLRISLYVSYLSKTLLSNFVASASTDYSRPAAQLSDEAEEATTSTTSTYAPISTYPNPLEPPTTESPTTQSPTTQSPTTQSPSTQSPTTQSPSTESPHEGGDSSNDSMSVTVDGALRVCRGSRYGPVMDPLGVSTPADPLPLSGTAPGQLCVDDQSTTYGPSDWAMFVLNTGPIPSDMQLRVGNLYVNYERDSKSPLDAGTSSSAATSQRVYLRYVDPVTKQPTLPPPSILSTTSSSSVTQPLNPNTKGHWWQYTEPFLAYRDLRVTVGNHTLARFMSEKLAASMQLEETRFAFVLIPGAMGWNCEAEVVVEAELIPRSSLSSVPRSRLEFRHLLHVTPAMTEITRYGLPPRAGGSPAAENQKGNLVALVTVTAVASLLLFSVVVFLAADNHKPLPQWVPRGALLRRTILSLVPTRGKKSKSDEPGRGPSAIPTQHKDVYDAISSGRYN